MTPYGVIGRERVKCYSMYVFVMSLPAISLGDWFCMSRKDRTEGGGLVHPKGEYSMAVSGRGCENSSVGPFSYFKHKWTSS